MTHFRLYDSNTNSVGGYTFVNPNRVTHLIYYGHLGTNGNPCHVTAIHFENKFILVEGELSRVELELFGKHT